jgi:hypothetical protein
VKYVIEVVVYVRCGRLWLTYVFIVKVSVFDVRHRFCFWRTSLMFVVAVCFFLAQT